MTILPNTIVIRSCPILCDSMNCSTWGFPVLHYLLEFSQTHVHWVGDDIQPSHPLSPPFTSFPQSCPASGSFPVSWLFSSSGQNIGVSASVSVVPMNIQGWFPLARTSLISLLSKGLLSSTTIQKHQIFGAQPSLWSKSHICTWVLEKPWVWLYGPLSAKWYLCFLIHCLGLS